MLDGRQYRSDQPRSCTADQRDPSGYCPEEINPTDHAGAEQRDWLLEELATTKSRWNVLAQQTGFSPFNRTLAPNPRPTCPHADNWDGYVAERQQILDWMVEHGTEEPGGADRRHAPATGSATSPGDYRDLAEPARGDGAARDVDLHRRQPDRRPTGSSATATILNNPHAVRS